ncbi:MAG TPA: hypothetical protein VH092_11765, partial [Urbifossiella sp.]|nr:hypothetical protein [Urbifossiella sp.]
AAFPFGAFEELKRQELESRGVLHELAERLTEGGGSADRGGADPARLAQLRENYAAAWRLHRRLSRDVRTAVRYLRTAPPMTVPGLRWVFNEDDLRQVPEQVLPPAGSPEWEGYHLA